MWNSKRMVSVIGSLGHGSRLARMMSHVTSSEIGSVPWKEIRIPVPWGHIAGKEWGNANGEPVLGLHGWVDNCATFDRLAPLLPLSQLRFIALDLPGHGHSSHLPPGTWYRWTDYVATVARVVDYFNWTKFSLIGHSMGAKVAFVYAGTFPDKINRLVSLDVHRPFPGGKRILIEPQEGFHYDWDYSIFYRSSIDYIMKIEKSSHSHSETKGRSMDELVQKMVQNTSDMNFMTADSARVILKWGTRLVSKNPDLYVLTRDQRLGVYDFLIPDQFYLQFCQRLTCDLLVIMADKGISTYFPEKEQEVFNLYKERLKFFKLEHIEGTHHEHLNNPERVAPAVCQFLLQSQ